MPMVFPTSPIVGQVFTSGGRSWVWNGSTWDSPARDNPTIVSGLQQVLYYTSSGTFTKATYPWLRAIRVKVQGAGGGGAGAAATAGGQVAMGGGGSGGVYAESFITDIAGLASSITVTRGAGGAGGAAGFNNGSNGGTSSFGSLVSANGGTGGGGGFAGPPNSVFPSPTAGPTAGTGDLVIAGGASYVTSQVRNDFVISLTSGSSFLGAASAWGDSTSQAGQTGRNYGGGGTGAQNVQSQSARAGGAGGPGIVIVELYA